MLPAIMLASITTTHFRMAVVVEPSVTIYHKAGKLATARCIYSIACACLLDQHAGCSVSIQILMMFETF